MAKIVMIHSFRRGVGRSTMLANLADILASRGLKVALIDTNFQSPSLDTIFGVEETDRSLFLNDFLFGRCEIIEAAYNQTTLYHKEARGMLFLIPASSRSSDISRIAGKGYDVELLNQGMETLSRDLELDMILIDTQDGLNEGALLLLSISDYLFISMRPDRQDFTGAKIVRDVVINLREEPGMVIVNMIPPSMDTDDLRKRVETELKSHVASMLPHSREMMALGDRGLFVREFPELPLSKELHEIANKIIG